MFVSLISVCFQELSNQLRAGVRLQPLLAGPRSKADDLLITQLRCQHCHWERVNTPPLQRDKTLYFSPLQLCKVSLAICVFNLALAFSICLQSDWPWKCEIPNREESQEAPAGLGAPANRRVQGGLAGVKAYSQGAAQGLVNNISGHLVAVQGCWASHLRAGGCGTLVSKAVTYFWWIPYYVRNLLYHTEVACKGKVSQGLTVSSAVTLAYLITAKWCFQSKGI